MADFKESGLIKNPFRMYRYEAVGAYRDFLFSDEPTSTRASTDEDGYDDVTRLRLLSEMPERQIERLRPFAEQIPVIDYIAMSERVSLEDIKSTQDWAAKSQDLEVLSRLGYGSPNPRKITSEELISMAISPMCEGEFDLDSVQGIDVNFVFHYNRSFNSVEVNVSNIAGGGKVDEARRFILPVEPMLYVPREIFSYYYDIDASQSRDATYKLLQHEYLPTPAMVFDSQLYRKIKDKIRKVTYSTSREG